MMIADERWKALIVAAWKGNDADNVVSPVVFFYGSDNKCFLQMTIGAVHMVDDHENMNVKVDDDMNRMTNDEDNENCDVVDHANKETSMGILSIAETLHCRRDEDEMSTRKHLSTLKKSRD